MRVAVVAVVLVAVPAVMVFVLVPVFVRLEGLRSAQKTKMSVRAFMSVSVDVVSVPMEHAGRVAHSRQTIATLPRTTQQVERVDSSRRRQ